MTDLSASKPWRYGLLLAVLLLAALLRFYRLDAQSFWNDEGNSARLSERSLISITAGTASDIHPPLYYYILHFWRAIFGHSEWALRALSVVCNLLAIWLIYLIGQRMFDSSVALAAAALAAVNPFQIYYAQETRMYAMLAMWATLSVYGMLEILAWGREVSSSELEVASCELRVADFRSHVLRFAPYVLASAAGLYTQYTFVFMIAVHNLAMLMDLLARPQQRARRALTWAGLQAVVAALYLPWLPVALSRTGGWGVETQAVALTQALLEVMRLFVYGLTLPTAQATLGLAAAGLLLLVGGIGGARKAYGWPISLLLTWWMLPVGAMLGLNLYREAYLKFLLIASPPLCLLLGWAAVAAWRMAGIPHSDGVTPRRRLTARLLDARLLVRPVALLVLALLVWPVPQSLKNLYFDPAYARDDYRGMARFVRQAERPDDAVLLLAPNQWEVFTYYYTDAGRVYPLALDRPLDAAAVAADLSRIAAVHPRVFVLYWGDGEMDPQRLYETWLAANAYNAGEQWWGRVRLALYATAPQAVESSPRQQLDVRLGPYIALQGYTLPSPFVNAGDVLQLTLFWQTSAPLAERYKVFVHLVDGGGQLAAQVDREPGANLLPTTGWPPGQVISDRYGLWLPAEIAPGRYSLRVGLYGLDGQRLPIAAGGLDQPADAFPLAEIEVR